MYELNFGLVKITRLNLLSKYETNWPTLGKAFGRFSDYSQFCPIMNIQELDNDLIGLIDKKIQLSRTDYNDPAYDEAEDRLHDLEDEFVDKYGTYLEEALQEVHDDICPDNDVLLPIAYLAQEYVLTGEERNGKPTFDVAFGNGVLVEVDDYPGHDTRIVILPNPLRIMLLVNGHTTKAKEIVWRATGTKA